MEAVLSLMRPGRNRTTLIAVVGLVLFVAGATAGIVLAGRDSDSRTGPYTEWEPQKWVLAGISSDQLTLKVAFSAGGCTSTRGRAELEESRSQVRIRVKTRVQHNVDCLLIQKTGLASVRLAKPLNGRRLEGSDRVGSFGPSGDVFIRGQRIYTRVPRTAGLGGRDARRLLLSMDFKVAPLLPGQREREVTGSKPPHRTPIEGEQRSRTPIRLLTK